MTDDSWVSQNRRMLHQASACHSAAKFDPRTLACVHAHARLTCCCVYLWFPPAGCKSSSGHQGTQRSNSTGAGGRCVKAAVRSLLLLNAAYGAALPLQQSQPRCLPVCQHAESTSACGATLALPWHERYSTSLICTWHPRVCTALCVHCPLQQNLDMQSAIEEARTHVAIVRSGDYATTKTLFDDLYKRQEDVLAKMGPTVMLGRLRAETDKV